MNTPVLFLIFNRPDKARRVFEAIARAKPKRLFVAADGPRPGFVDDIPLCRAAREISEDVDWDCEVRTLFRDENLGCGKGIADSINWFFEQVEDGIVLEDDCLPSDSFFVFCSEMLERYRVEERVMMVSGNNFQNGVRRGDASYYFSQVPHLWGWATWRRAWAHYDFNMSAFPEWLRSGAAEAAWPDPDVRNFWLSKLMPTFEGRIVAWDYQWAFSILSRQAVSVCPAVNLVSNIGFGNGATNTSNRDDPCAGCERYDLTGLSHPAAVVPNAAADLYEYERIFNVRFDSIKNRLFRFRKVLRKRWKMKRMTERFTCRHCAVGTGV